MNSTTAGQAEERNSFFPVWPDCAKSEAICDETKSAPKAVSETPANPSFFNAATICALENSENSEAKEGARET